MKHKIRKPMVLTAGFLVLLICVTAYGQDAEQSMAEATDRAQSKADGTAQAESEKASEDKAKDYDLTALPDGLRQKVESYLKDQKELEKEVERLDAMSQGASNPWAHQRATGMATKLNYEIKNLRLKRREIIREYRELLLDGWTPPESMSDFESLFFNDAKQSDS